MIILEENFRWCFETFASELFINKNVNQNSNQIFCPNQPQIMHSENSSDPKDDYESLESDVKPISKFHKETGYTLLEGVCIRLT